MAPTTANGFVLETRKKNLKKAIHEKIFQQSWTSMARGVKLGVLQIDFPIIAYQAF